MKGDNLLATPRKFKVCEALRYYNSVHTNHNLCISGCPFWLGRPENLALHQHNQNRRKESWMVLDEALQRLWKTQTATSCVPIPNKIQELILMLVNTSFLVTKCLYSWLFLLGRHRYYSELIWKKQHLSQQNTLFNIHSIPGMENHYVAYQVQKQESLNASRNNCYQLMTLTICCSSFLCLS